MQDIDNWTKTKTLKDKLEQISEIIGEKVAHTNQIIENTAKITNGPLTPLLTVREKIQEDSLVVTISGVKKETIYI